MGSYDIQQVCLNGHQITDSYNQFPQFRKKFCDKCGERTIHQCPACNHPIKGFYQVEGVITGSRAPVPSHCENCGKPYPWSIPKIPATIGSLPDKNDLHPWPIILSMLQELSSDEICRIIGLSGLQVNWNLTKDQSFSHTTRKRAYLPKIQSAYEELSDEKKLSAAWIVAEEIRRIDDDLVSKINSRLSLIGWEIGKNGLTTHDVQVRELFFPTGKQYDAYVEIRKIIQQATNSIFIIDPYIDSTMFQLISSNSSPQLKVRFLSFNLSQDFTLEAGKFVAQYNHFELEVRKTNEFHDRFIICDDTYCFHIGASIKDAGKKAFMISKLEDVNNINTLLQQLQQSWDKATPVTI
jgi:hypothetical protein